MTTITVWLLMNIAAGGYQNGKVPASVVERFVTLQECERVSKWLNDSKNNYANNTACIQATIIK